MHALAIIGIMVLCLAMILSLGLNIFGLPGNWIILALAIVAGAFEGFDQIGLNVILILLGLALFAELLEFMIGYAGARLKGASRWASLAALIGGIAGAFMLGGTIPVIGALVGIFAGAFLGAFIVEMAAHGKLGLAYQSGIAAMFGRVGSILSKMAVGAAMIVVAIYRLV